MGSNTSGGSERLQNLAQQLRLYNNFNGNPNFVPEEPDPISKNPIGKSKPRRAAVLICLFEGEEDGDLRVILTKRSSKLSTHSGEVSLPGGKTEEGDADDVATALREAKEEIGLEPSLVNVVTVLDPFLTKNGITVVPVIALLPNKKAFDPLLNPAEVESIFYPPLEMFLKDENRWAEEKEWKGEKYVLHFFDYEENNEKFVIWALTAGILIKAASVVYRRPPAFQENKPRFWIRSHQ